jgi:hypothetical protein
VDVIMILFILPFLSLLLFLSGFKSFLFFCKFLFRKEFINFKFLFRVYD